MADIAEQCWRAAASQGPPAAFFSIESSRGGSSAASGCSRAAVAQTAPFARGADGATALKHFLLQLQIPVQLRLAENEVSSLEHPPVLYFLVPRQSYLHSLVPRALQMLEHLLPPGDHVPWFEHAHLPLKWGVPAGVLYDLVAAPSAELPWRLTIHFRSYPDRLLAAYGGEAALRASFFTSLKEAACICRGSAQRVMEMAAGAQEDLWRQVVSSRLQPYSQVMASLQLAPVAQRGGRSPAIPIRLYVRQGVGGYLSSYEDISVTSRPVEALAADGSAVTLRQALLPLLAECVTGSRGADSTAASLTVPDTLLAASSGSTTLVGNDRGSLEAATASSDAKPAAEPEVGAALVEAGSGAAESGDASSPARDSTSNAAGHNETGVGGATESTCLLEASVTQRRLLVAGTTPPLDAPLAWLHAQLHAPDFFLYIVLHAGR